MKNVLIIDDEECNRRAIARLLFDIADHTSEAGNGIEALARLQAGEKPDIIILDLMMPRMDGLDFLRQAAELKLLHAPVFICSANSDITLAIEAMKLGAIDYMEKPIEPEIFRTRIQNLFERQELRRQNTDLKQRLRETTHRRLLGNSTAIQGTLHSIERLANSNTTVLIHGESGTGKELVAHSLHDSGNRAAAPFMIVDCAAIHGNTIESELFGHERGAYTGADQKREGLLVAAGSGTVFFDEVGELPLELQSKLLRVLQERQVRAIGSTYYRPLSARIIAATNRDLMQEVKAGRFREDLYYRLSIVQLRLPPLRERIDDIELLAAHFLNKYSSDFGVHELTQQATEALQAYNWPGNVRQLENAIHHALAMLPEGEDDINVANLPEELRGGVTSTANYPLPSGITPSFPLLSMRQLEQQAITRALEFTQGNRRQASELLGIGEATLYRKIKEFGL